MKIHYDCEFIEDGRTIDLISIGMVAEDGREYYAVSRSAGMAGGWKARIGENAWLMENVVPSLPVKVQRVPTRGGGIWNYVTWDENHPDHQHLKARDLIANEVREFILATPGPELWAWYAAYDHVALCQLWGPMISLPEGVPMWTNDLKQEVVRLGNPGLPPMPGVAEHNALSDAREVAWRHQWLAGRTDAPQ